MSGRKRFLMDLERKCFSFKGQPKMSNQLPMPPLSFTKVDSNSTPCMLHFVIRYLLSVTWLIIWLLVLYRYMNKWSYRVSFRLNNFLFLTFTRAKVNEIIIPKTIKESAESWKIYVNLVQNQNIMRKEKHFIDQTRDNRSYWTRFETGFVANTIVFEQSRLISNG